MELIRKIFPFHRRRKTTQTFMEKPFREGKIFISCSINSRRFDRSQPREGKKKQQQNERAPSDPRSINYTQQHSFCHLRVVFVRFLIHLSLTARKKTSQSRRRKILRLKTESNIDWIFSACASIFTSANSRFACLCRRKKGFLCKKIKNKAKNVLRKLNIWHLMATVNLYIPMLAHKLFQSW